MSEEGHSLGFGLSYENAVEGVFVWWGVVGAFEGLEGVSMPCFEIKLAHIGIFTQSY